MPITKCSLAGGLLGLHVLAGVAACGSSVTAGEPRGTSRPGDETETGAGGQAGSAPTGSGGDAGSAGPSLLSCDHDEHELPVVTHWSNAIQGFAFLAADTIDLYAPFPTEQPHAPGTCYPTYARGLEDGGMTPDHGLYPGETYAVSAVDDAAAKDFFRELCETTGTPFVLLRPDAFDPDEPLSESRLKLAPGYVQVLHALVVDGSLATIYLPPNWAPDASGEPYPIVANSFYDINDDVFLHEGPSMARMIAMSGTDGRTGAIGVLHNGGGAASSRSMNPEAFHQFAAVVDVVANRLGGDRHRILTFGGSRGGWTALAFASNPYGHDYTVRYAAAAAAPALLGEHGLLASVTYPGLLHAVGWSTGLQDAWRTDWQYPACAGRAHLTGLTAVEAHAHVLTGTADPAYADEHLSLLSDAFIGGLLAAGTKVHLEVTSHDNIVPFAHQAQYAARLLAEGAPVEVDVLVRSGHTDRSQGGFFGSVKHEWIADALRAYVEPGAAAPGVDPKLAYYRVDRATGKLEPFAPQDGMVPFFLDAPYRAALGQRVPLVLVGHPGTEVSLALRRDGAEVAAFGATIPEDLKQILWVDIPKTYDFVGTYSYDLKIKKPGSNEWLEIPPESTPNGAPATVEVFAEEPNLSHDEAFAATMGPTAPGHPNTCWGLSEY